MRDVEAEHLRQKRDELSKRRIELMISNMELAELSKSVDPSGRGLHYQTLRRLDSGSSQPRAATLRLIERVLDHVEAGRDSRVAV